MKQPSQRTPKRPEGQSSAPGLQPLLGVPEAAVKVGRLTKLRLEDIEAFINKNCREAGSQERYGHHEGADEAA